ncbi:Methylcrotonoyl-CoA carboxylase subunit alpha, mitochondrial [Balamuthia mandrillaris]
MMRQHACRRGGLLKVGIITKSSVLTTGGGCGSSSFPFSSLGVTSVRHRNSLAGERQATASTNTRMFDKILVANRGEIACRVMRTCKKLGVKAVAVYSEADAKAQHVAMADEAFLIGPAPARQSYLRGEAILEVARRTGAQAIHPGYGFLSENATFADMCSQHDLVFIGPPASAITAMGSKSESKKIMTAAAVPVVPGYHGLDQDVARLTAEADRIGYPVLIKAIMGGGGKGMRIVHSREEFEEALLSAKRESMASFGDDRVLVEKYLQRPRHVEFQIFGDSFGNVVHLNERDCSVQRRHQKILEEAPAPNITDELRKAMGLAAVNAAKAVGYVGAGTVEFILDEDGSFYFMEMNTRLQVEHPVTEMITNVDLVEWQLKVASGQSLPLQQDQINRNGHAFEARVYAENPNRGFLPGTGKLVHLSPPKADHHHVRVETGVKQGDEVSVYYDPMIAKLVVWDRDRNAALRRLKLALEDYQIVGLNTNIEFLQKLAMHPSFIAGEVETGFIQRHHKELFEPAQPPSTQELALAALYVLHEEKEDASQSAFATSPWSQLTGWRSNEQAERELKFLYNENEETGESGDRPQTCSVHVTYCGNDQFELRTSSSLAKQEDTSHASARQQQQGILATSVQYDKSSGKISAQVGGETVKARLVRDGSTLHIFHNGIKHTLNIPVVRHSLSAHSKGSLFAPMPGKIIKVIVKPGQRVQKGQPVVIMEAMKMEHTIRSAEDGVVKSVHCAPEEFVANKHCLVRMEGEEQ